MCVCMCTDVYIDMVYRCVCELWAVLGGKSIHRGPVYVDLYYSLPFAVSSHAAAECERGNY